MTRTSAAHRYADSKAAFRIHRVFQSCSDIGSFHSVGSWEKAPIYIDEHRGSCVVLLRVDGPSTDDERAADIRFNRLAGVRLTVNAVDIRYRRFVQRMGLGFA